MKRFEERLMKTKGLNPRKTDDGKYIKISLWPGKDIECQFANYGSDSVGESRDTDIVCATRARKDACDLYKELKGYFPDVDLRVITGNGVYPKVSIPEIFTECIINTTGIDIVFSSSSQIREELAILYKMAIESILEGETQKGIFKLLQFIVIKQSRSGDYYKFEPGVFTKSGLCKKAGYQIFDSQKKIFDASYAPKIVDHATSLLGEEVMIEVNSNIHVKYCAYDTECDEEDEEIIEKNEEVSKYVEISERELLVGNEARDDILSYVLKNKNVSFTRNSQIKLVLFGATRWVI